MTRVFLAGLIGAVVVVAPALAQIPRGLPGPVGAPGGSTRPEIKPQQAPPPSVPGSRAEPSGAAAPERPVTDMPPTEALFDAINRGDLVGAKDAISRGADIHGRNVLGLTPLELAVDLGRNNISFLLLSLRGESGYGASPPTTAKAAEGSSPRGAVERRQAQRADRRARQQEAATARAGARQGVPAPPRTARLFAGDGGTPVPQAGFLGFDSAR